MFIFSSMATRLAYNVTPHSFDTIEQQIEEETDKVIQLVHRRKQCLLVDLREYRFQYDNLVANKSETEKELLNFKQHTENLAANELKGMQDSILSDIEEKLDNHTQHVNFSWMLRVLIWKSIWKN